MKKTLLGLCSLFAAHTAVGQAVLVAPTSLNLFEGGPSATYQVVLDTMPAAGETITITPVSIDVTEATVSPALSFDDSNWDQPQTVTVTPGPTGDGNDGDVMATTSNNLTSSLGGASAYNGVMVPSVATTTQNVDGVAVITVSPSSGTGLWVTEGNSTTIVISGTTGDLNPAQNISFDLTTASPEITLSTTTIVLNSSNMYSTTVDITAVDDMTVDGDVDVTITTEVASSTDGNFNGIDPVDIQFRALDLAVAPPAPATPAATSVPTLPIYGIAMLLLGLLTVVYRSRSA